jgi:hypothetical protein
MATNITLVGAQADEQAANVAVYSLDARGRITAKVGAVVGGHLNVDVHHLPAEVLFGPDVEDPASLDPASLLRLRVADQLPNWEANKAILIPAQWWRRWLGFQTCVSGEAFRCFPFAFGLREFESIALGKHPIPLREFCQPLCSGIVEVWTNTCCCRPPFLLSAVAGVIANLRQFLADNPVMFPVPPRPDPGPVDPALRRSVNLALGAGKVDYRFAPSADLSTQLQTLERLPAADAMTHIEANSILWPFWCHCHSNKLSETPLNPNGTFQYCYWHYPFLIPNCRTSYFYKVKQLIGGQWVYVYDGALAHQYFSADQVAELHTLSGRTCFQPPPIDGTDFVALATIGLTNSWELNSGWNGGQTIGGVVVDKTQTGDFTLSNPPADGGLVASNGAPWAQTLSFLLDFDPGIFGLGAYYYRMSYVQADLSGKPLNGAAPTAFPNAVVWNKLVLVGANFHVEQQTLGPVSPVNGVVGLCQIPPVLPAGESWDGINYHQTLDTTQLLNGLWPGAPTGNGRFLVVVEIFDKNGHRLIPNTATKAPGSTDIKTAFSFLRLLTSGGAGSTASVPFCALTHLIWVDNRPVVGDIDEFLVISGGQTTASSEECQFLTAPGGALFEVGYRAYHAVSCDQSPSPIPTRTFMNNFALDWQEGLNGPNGVLAQGGDTNQPNPAWPTCPNNASPAISLGTMTSSGASPPGSTVPSSFANLLGNQTACAFAITLHVVCKHTNGISHISGYDREIPSAVALSIGP